jgi:protein FAM32A
MSDYDFRPGGALKLKGAAANGGTKRYVLRTGCGRTISHLPLGKSPRKIRQKTSQRRDLNVSKQRIRKRGAIVRLRSTLSSPQTSKVKDRPRPLPVPAGRQPLNAVSRRFRNRGYAVSWCFHATSRCPHLQRAEKIAKLASRTHKERVQEFNEKLESLSEHHDIPKVGIGISIQIPDPNAFLVGRTRLRRPDRILVGSALFLVRWDFISVARELIVQLSGLAKLLSEF